MGAPATLPADFFSKQDTSKPPETLPADFFSKEEAPTPRSNEPTPRGSTVHEVGQGILDTTFRQVAPMIKMALGTGDMDSAVDAMKNGDYTGAIGHVLKWATMGPAGRAAQSIIQAGVNEAQKAREAWGRGEHVEAAGHAAAAALPIVGPMAASIGETAGGTEPTYDKYGNIISPGEAPNIPRAAGQAIGLGASVLAPKVAESVIPKITEPLAETLQESAEKQYAQVLNPTTRGNKLRTARVVPELIDRGVTAMTTKGLQTKAMAGMAKAGQALEDAYENLPEGTSIPLKSVQDTIRNAADEAFTVPTEAKNLAGEPAGRIPMSEVADVGLKHASDLADRLVGVAKADPATGELVIPVDAARRLRQYYDSVAAQAGRYDAKALAEHSTAEAHGMAADAIRQHLNDIETGDSTLGDLNKEYSFWKDVNQVVTDTINRRQGQAKPLGRKILSAAGAAGGFGVGGIKGGIIGKEAMDALEAATTSPAWRTVSAVLKNRLANAIAGGDVSQINALSNQARDDAKQLETVTEPAPVPEVTTPTAAPVPEAPSPAGAPAVQTPEVAPIQSGQPQAVKIPRATNLTAEEQPVQESFAKQVESNPQAALDEYRSRFTRPEGTIEINSDNARELSPDYAASKDARSKYARAVHEPSSWIAKQVYQQELGKPAPEGVDNRVVFTAGGTGAGKTVGTKILPGENPPQILYDTNSNNFESAQGKIQAALDAGKKVDIRYVHRLPEAAFESMLDRAAKTGRTVPIESHIETHTGAPEALLKLADVYKDDPRVDIKVIDNTGGPGEAKIGTIDMLRGLDYTGLEERLQNAIEAHGRAGTVSPEIYQGVTGRPLEPANNPKSQPNQPSGAGTARETGGAVPQAQIVRPVGHQASNDIPSTWTRENHAYRGMTQAEFNDTVGKGAGVMSKRNYSLQGEGTSLAPNADTAEGYINFGRDDPRKTGAPTYVVEVSGGKDLTPNRQGYLESSGPIPQGRITRIWQFTNENGAVVAKPMDVPPTPKSARMADVAAYAAQKKIGIGAAKKEFQDAGYEIESPKSKAQ